jgi:hypothetical protein
MMMMMMMMNEIGNELSVAKASKNIPVHRKT